MMLVFNERRIVPVLRYSDITEHYNQYNEARHLYWERLQAAASQLAVELSESLDLPAATWKDGEGKNNAYVQIGSMKDGEFKRVHPVHLEGDDLHLELAIRITLEEGENILPKAFYVQNVRLKSTATALQVKLGGVPELVINAPKEAGPGQFGPAVEAIKVRLLGMMDMQDLV